MALHMRLMVNCQQIGYLEAQRRSPEHPQGDDECLYDWRININGKTLSNMDDEPLPHRYGDGAWALVARVIHAAGYAT